MIAVAPGARGDRGQIGAGAGLGHGDGRDQRAGGAAREPALLLREAAELVEVRDADVGVERHREAGLVDGGELLDRHHEVEEIAAGAAERRLEPGAEEAALAGLSPRNSIAASCRPAPLSTARVSARAGGS
jgi:hypothetical protein